jgi:hypothetical protein
MDTARRRGFPRQLLMGASTVFYPKIVVSDSEVDLELERSFRLGLPTTKPISQNVGADRTGDSVGPFEHVDLPIIDGPTIRRAL